MYKIALKLTFVLFAAFLASSCHEQKIEVSEKLVLNKDSFSYALENQFNKWTVLVCQDQLMYMDTLKTFYKNRNFKPLWWDAILGDSASWAYLENTFKYSEQHGMDYRYYCLPLVDYYRQKIPLLSTQDSAFRIMTELELIISNSMLRMYKDIANGRSNPKTVYGYIYMLPRNNWKKMEYETFLNTTDKTNFIEQIHKNDTTYQELLKVMKYYVAKKANEKSKAVDFSGYPKIVLGDSAPVIQQLITRLKQRKIPDEEILEIADTMVYTKELQKQIKKLQSKNNLTPDGILGYKTYRLINSTPNDKLNQVKANLERQRWFTEKQSPPYVYINLAEYVAYMHWQDSIKSMKVCIGKNLPDNYDAMVKQYTDSGWLYKLPKNMETPQIASKITYIVLNPTWTVPYSIIKNEMWWNMVKDPTYLKRKGFNVFRGKTQVNSDTIDWRKISRDAIPYTVVEKPGPGNSLGTVKYMFNNPFSIYLHDTPNKAAFKLTQRAVSHGCVRLEKPLEFGEFLMQNSKRYTPDDFRIMMGYAPFDEERLKNYDPLDTLAPIKKITTTKSLPLETSMPLYLDYRTVYFDDEWTLKFAYDIYDQNKLIIKEMDRM